MILYCYNCYWSNWVHTLNPIEIFIASIVGITTGYFASKIFTNTTEKNKRKHFDSKYKSLEGRYLRWFKENKEKGDGRIIAKAYLKHYSGENRLGISVETFIHPNGKDLDSSQEWTGEVIMDTIRSGTIVWEQRKPDNGNNGFKRLIIDKNQGRITLVGESDQGFGVERFTEKEIDIITPL